MGNTRRRPFGNLVSSRTTYLTLSVTTGLFSGCGIGEADNTQLNTPDACVIALTPDNNNDDVADGAITRLREKVLEDPADLGIYLERLGWAYVAKARKHFDAGYYALAEQCALCLESKQPNSTAARLLRAYALHNQHRFKEAETLARELVTERGLSLDYALYGDTLMEQGALEEAIDAYQTMMDLKPGPHAYSRSAHVRWLKGDLPGAIELMEMTAGASGSHDPQAAAWAYERLAAYELQAGRVSRAEMLLARALALQPDYAPALLAKGQLLLLGDKSSEALAVLTRAAQLNPLPAYQWTLIEALYADNRDIEAQALHSRLMERGGVDDRRTFALYLASTGHAADKALVLAEQELRSRRDVMTLATYAWALKAAGRITEAHEFSKRSLREGTRQARLHYHAGVIARRAGDRKAAARWLKSAVSMQQSLLPSERRLLHQELTELRARMTRSVTLPIPDAEGERRDSVTQGSPAEGGV